MGKTIKESEIKEDLMNQLNMQGKYGKFFVDQVNDYIYFWKLKTKLQKDIKNNGLRYKVTNGNGKNTEKYNESVIQLPKINTQMLKILNDLGLNQPFNEQPDDIKPEEIDEDDYLQ